MDIKSCRLAGGEELEYASENGWHRFNIPGDDVNPLNTIIEIEIEGEALNIDPLEVPSQSKSFLKKVSASSNPNPRWNGADNVVNGDWVGHYWMPGMEDSEPWIEIDLGQEELISQAIIFEASRTIEEFELQCKIDGEWSPIHKGNTIGEKTVIEFPETASRYVRLLITEFSDTPGIYEIILF